MSSPPPFSPPLRPLSAIHCSSLAPSGQCCRQVTDGQYPLLSCLWAGPSGQDYAVCDPIWAVMTEYGSVCSPCCFQGQFIQARERKGELRRSSCISSPVRHRTEKRMGVIYYLPHVGDPNTSGSNVRDIIRKEMEIRLLQNEMPLCVTT